MDDCPTLTKLMKYGEERDNIIDEIGEKYHKFGTLLLEDETGSKMRAIEDDERRAVAINNRVLTRWIRGEGKEPTSWATLTTVLDKCGITNVIRSMKASPS